MSGETRNRSKMVAQELLYLVGEQMDWVRECNVMK